ncbi:MAG: hypothetical protein JSU07_07355 [Bacteroidetes bacterium]|nr:hypothetical protein [Bacteroidota bacterium]
MLISTNNIEELNRSLNEQCLLSNDLATNDNLAKLFNLIYISDSLLTKTDLKHNLSEHLIFAFYNDGFLIAVNTKNNSADDVVEKTLNSYFNVRENAFNFNGSSYYLMLKNGLLLISNNANIINKSFDTKIKKFITSKNFQSIKPEFTEDSHFNVFINQSYFKKNNMETSLNYFFKRERSLENIFIKPNQISSVGLLYSSDTIAEILKLQNPQVFRIANSLPDNVLDFKSFGLSDYKANYFTNKLYWSNINDSALYNLSQDFFKNISSNLVEFRTGDAYNPVTAFLVNDSSICAQHIKFLSDSIIKSNATIFKLKQFKKSNSVLFSPFTNTRCEYAFLKNSVLYFSEDKKNLEKIYENITNGLSLANSNSYNEFIKDQGIDDFNYFYYSSTKSYPLSFYNFFGVNKNTSKRVYQYAYQLTNYKNVLKSRWSLYSKTDKQINGNENFLWTVSLDTTIIFTPSKFKNHITSENEIIVADANKNLYLINAKGNILWKKHLNELPDQAIYTIDIFKNAKYQILFNSKNYLHLIDRNGNYVEGYPVKTPAEITCPITLIDYDNDKNYRIIFPCNNKTLYNYSAFGVKHEGFTPIKTKNKVILPVYFIRLGLSDYLTAIDEGGEVYLFSRKGDIRAQFKNKSIEHCKSYCIEEGTNFKNTYFAYLDENDNSLNKVFFSDEKNILKLNENEKILNHKFINANNNIRNMLLVQTENAISLFNLNGEKAKNLSLNAPINKISYSEIENANLLCGLDMTNSNLYFNKISKTKTTKGTGLPLLIDLFNSGKPYLIYSEGKALKCISY